MRHLALILLLGLLAGGVSYGLMRLGHRAADPARSVNSGADLEWLRGEFGLDEVQFAAIRQLHLDYAVVCSVHCANILSAQTRLGELQASGAAAAEIATAARALGDLETVCNDATREHLQQVASLMPAAQGERFLRMTLPHLATMPHDGARGLRR